MRPDWRLYNAFEINPPTSCAEPGRANDGLQGRHERASTVRYSAEATMSDELSFKVVRSNGTDEVLARAINLLIARGAHREAAPMYPRT